MSPVSRTIWLAAPAALVFATAQAADFAAPGARATLTVEYRFEAQGRYQTRQDLHEWKVMRRAELSAEMEARKPTALPSLHKMEAGQQARLSQQQAQAKKAQAEMAPMMAGAQAIMDKCGDDDRCLEREAMKMGAAMSGTPQAAAAQNTLRETNAVMQAGADRYQAWAARSQKGKYAIDEAWHVVHADPICMRLPGARCTHDMARKGGGEIPAGKSPAMLEVDTQGSLFITLPVPITLLAYTETHTTDEPSGTHSSATPKGPQPGQMPLRVTADAKSNPPPLKVALKGGWRSQSGEEVLNMDAGGWHDAPGTGGKLVIKWRFSAS